MEPKYYLTKEQLDCFDHYKRMFENTAERIKELCKGEKDDIVYGFELGELHSSLRQWFVEMMELESEIKQQELTKKEG